MWQKHNIEKRNRFTYVIYLLCFLLLLICNLLTPYVVDDFQYAFSFATDERLESIWDIIPSMIAHCKSMNGRIVAHSLVQFFSLFPNWVFDVINSIVFVLQIVLVIKLCGAEKYQNMVFVILFCGIWMVELDFGQVNLWQDGAVNYLWSIPICSVYLIPFVELYRNGEMLDSPKKKLMFLIMAFLAGAYSETVSAATIFMAILLLLLFWFEEKKVVSIMLAAVILAFAGYISIYLAPAQWMNKSVELSLKSLLSSFLNAVYKYEEICILLIPYVILLILNLTQNTQLKNICLSVVFLLGSLAANFIMVFAEYYPGRSAVGALVFLLAANIVLLPPLLEGKRFKLFALCCAVVLVLVSLPQVIHGCRDIAVCYINLHARENVILVSKENDILDVEVPAVYVESPYCAVLGWDYLNMTSAEKWPNNYMAKYYGVNSIIGVK